MSVLFLWMPQVDCDLWFGTSWAIIWAATWQNQQSECALSEDSHQPGHPPSLIRVFACAHWVGKDPSLFHADSEASDAQSGLSLRWALSHFVGFAISRFISKAFNILLYGISANFLFLVIASTLQIWPYQNPSIESYSLPAITRKISFDGIFC